ncbi:MAG: hypothetical protein V1745_02335 [Patescibacteria group bacterium]
MKPTPPIAGLVQAAGLSVYVFAVVSFISSMEKTGAPKNPQLVGMTMLLLFVLSAMISASIMLGYPAFLFRDGKIKEALKVIGWSIGWLAAIFGIVLTVTLAT